MLSVLRRDRYRNASDSSHCPLRPVQAYEAENLILVCGNCHARIEAGDIPVAAVKRKKQQAQAGALGSEGRTVSQVEVTNTTNHGIIANTVAIRVSGDRAAATAAPSGTIATDGRARNYAKYLIDRYHEFKVADVGKANMNYARFYVAIRRKFRAKWVHVPLSRFPELVEFLQHRIDHTIQGKNQKASGILRYQSYEEYIENHG